MDRTELQEGQLQMLMGLGAGFMIFILAVMVYAIIVYWKVYSKAGQPGWAVLIPIYNLIVFFKIIGRPVSWIFTYLGLAVLYIIGFVMIMNHNGGIGGLLTFLAAVAILVVVIIDINRLSKSFGQGAGFTVGLLFLRIIFMSILAFGSSYKYIGPNGVGEATANDNPEILHS